MPEYLKSKPTVINSENEVSLFNSDRFAGGLIKNGVTAEHSIRAADLVKGLLTGLDSPKISTDALRSVNSIINENPNNPDLHSIKRVLIGNYLPRHPVYDALTITDFYQAIAKNANADILASPQFILVSSLERYDGSKFIGRQDVALVSGEEGPILEVTSGMVNATHILSNPLPLEKIIKPQLRIDSVEMARKFFRQVHPLYSTSTGYNGLSIRSFALSNLPNFPDLYRGEISYSPKWAALVANKTTGVLSIANAVTGELEFMTVIPTSNLMLAGATFSSFGWGDAWDVFCKLAAIVALGAAIIPVGGLGAGTSWSGIGAVLAAIGIMILLLAIIKKIIDIILEAMDEDAASKAEAALGRLNGLWGKIEDLKKKAESGDISEVDANTEIKDLLEEGKGLTVDLKELTGGSGPLGPAGEVLDDVGGILEDASSLIPEPK